jgi:glutamate-1-semialdehyde 2,1-aminomutase
MKRLLSQSQNLQSRANRVIAHGALTNSKRPQCFVEGVYPTHIHRGIDALTYDVDQNKYVDYICGLGTHLFGYRNEHIHGSVTAYLSNRGAIFSLGSELEVEVAENICDKFPQIEMLRFLKTGSEACSAALRIARAATGRSHVVSEGYHGWHDEFTSLTPPSIGIPQQQHIRKHPKWPNLNELAAVIVEPVITEMSDVRTGWLHELRSFTRKCGALLIFDETVTGLRFPSMSVAKHLGIDPDLTIMGKAIGGGFPLALVGGKREVMAAEYFVSSTFAGDCVGLSGARAVLNIIKDATVLERLEVQAKAFQLNFNHLNPSVVSLEGYGTRCAFKFQDNLTMGRFFQECCKAGVLFGPSFFYGTKHSVHDEFTLSVCKSVLNKISNNAVKLEGNAPVVPFVQRARE